MRTYAKEILTNKRRVFNYSVSLAQKTVDWTFGILRGTFMIFEGPVCCEEETVNSIVKASVVLHNLLRIREGLFP